MSRVLVVDDMPIFREPIAACLRNAGYQSLVAGDGKQALAVLQATPPDLILLDVAMPVMDGLTFLAALRADPATHAIPVILLTAASDKAHIVQAGRLGVQAYMLKSQFSLQELLERVKKLVPPGAPVLAAAATSSAAPREAAANTAAPFARADARRAAAPSALDSACSAPRLSRVTATASQPRAGASAPGLPDPLSPQEREERIAGAIECRSFTTVVSQIVALANSPRSAISDLAAMISRDPIIATRVLHVANSAAYTASHGPVSTVDEAVRRIGCAVVGRIAVAASVVDAAPRTPVAGFEPIRYLQHVLAVAALCERLAPSASDHEKAIAHLTGICHDMGELLFSVAFGPLYQRLCAAARGTGADPVTLEAQVLGASKAELEQEPFNHLELPPSISAPISAFHRARARARAAHGARACGKGSGAGDSATLRLALADAYANGLLLASHPHALVQPVTTAEARAATGRDDPPALDAAAFRADILTLAGRLGHYAPGQESRWMAPLFARTSRRILLVRAPGLCDFDPVQAALESLARVTTVEVLPASFHDCDAAVILAPSDTQRGFTAADLAAALSSTPRPAPLPLLWLVARRLAPPRPAPAPQPTEWPVRLDQLATLVA